MADYRLWGVIRRVAALDAYIVVVTAMPDPPNPGRPRVEVFTAHTIGEAESIRGNKLMEWGYEIRSRGDDRVIDVVDD